MFGVLRYFLDNFNNIFASESTEILKETLYKVSDLQLHFI